MNVYLLGVPISTYQLLFTIRKVCLKFPFIIFIITLFNNESYDKHKIIRGNAEKFFSILEKWTNAGGYTGNH
jgi:hypothetical protein